MKILHVVPTYLPAVRYGGPIVAVHGLCKALAARGHEVDVFTTNVDGDAVLDVPAGEPVLLDGVRVHYFPSTFRRLYRSPRMEQALQDAGRYDVIHTHAVYLWPGVAAARAGRRAGVPYVISPRGMLVPELIRGKSRVVKTLWLALAERRGFAHASGIHFTSQLEWEDAKRTGLLPLPAPFVIPNGVDVKPRPAVPRHDRTLLHLGRISWKKGLDAVIEVLPSLPGVRFVIAGNDDEQLTPRLAELARTLGVADRVEFPGPVYGAAKNELLARATLFVLASKSENFGNAVLEALAMETPAVLSRGVGLADEVIEADAGALGLESIEALLGDPERRARMGRNGRALVETKFRWDGVAQAMEAAYASRMPQRTRE
jgi:glycosyltransferase involved in cell wall biosynthesis